MPLSCLGVVFSIKGFDVLLSSLREFATSLLLKKRLRGGSFEVVAQNEHVLFCAEGARDSWCILDRNTARVVEDKRIGMLKNASYFEKQKTFLTEVNDEDNHRGILSDTGLYDKYGKKLSGQYDYPVVVFKNGNILFTARTKDNWSIIRPDGTLVWQDELFEVCILDDMNILAYARTGVEDQRAYGVLNQEGVWKQRDLASFVHFRQIYSQDKFAVDFEKNGNVSRWSAYAAAKNGLYGILNSKGEWMVAPEYEEAHYLPSGKGTFLKKGGLWYSFDENGKNIEGRTYEGVGLMQNDTFAAKTGGRWSLLSYQHTPRRAETFETVVGVGNAYLVSAGGKAGVIDADFTWLIPQENHAIWPVHGAFLVQKMPCGKLSIIATDRSVKFDSIIDEFRAHDIGLYFLRFGEKWSVVWDNAVAIRDRFDDVRSSSRRDLFFAKVRGLWSLQRVDWSGGYEKTVAVTDLRALTASEAQDMEKTLPCHAPRIIGEDAAAIDFVDRSLDVLAV